MASKHEEFWQSTTFAVVGHTAVKPFPSLTYKALREREGTTVYPVDPSQEEIEGDKAYDSLADLPGSVEAVVLEPPRDETAAWVEQAAEAGATKIWIHMGRESPEALALAQEKQLSVCTGTCAVQYLDASFPHNVHRFLRKLTGRW